MKKHGVQSINTPWSIEYRLGVRYQTEQRERSFGETLRLLRVLDSEYFMTHGHFHLKRNRTEYYATVEGEGALILMDESRRTWMEPMSAGSLHFIPPNIAHRVANSGKLPLRFVACWPSDAGHDYDAIRRLGFSERLLIVNGKASLVESEK
jgi:glucose-6-phosphate isomerase